MCIRDSDYTRSQKVRGYEDSSDWKKRSADIKPAPSAEIKESNAVKERRLLEWEAELSKREQALGDDASSDDS